MKGLRNGAARFWAYCTSHPADSLFTLFFLLLCVGVGIVAGVGWALTVAGGVPSACLIAAKALGRLDPEPEKVNDHAVGTPR